MKNLLTINAVIISFSACFILGCSTSSKENPKSYTVEIKGMQFQPAELSVHKGDTVVFINNDFVVHDVTEEKNKKWSSSPLAAGQSFSLIVTESSDYYCTIHPVMKGKLSID